MKNQTPATLVGTASKGMGWEKSAYTCRRCSCVEVSIRQSEDGELNRGDVISEDALQLQLCRHDIIYIYIRI